MASAPQAQKVGEQELSQWDNIELSHTIEYKQRVKAYNTQASNDLPIDQQHISTKTTKIINRRTGSTREGKSWSIATINAHRQKACIAKYWIRKPKSNSLGYEFRAVQNNAKCIMDL